MEAIDGVFSTFSGKREEMIPILQGVQAKFGFLSEDSMEKVARFLRVPPSSVYAVATFYSQFRFKPVGRNRVMICRGTACHVKGAPRVLEETGKVLGIKEGETTADGEYSLETVACIGCCSLSPCLMVNDRVEANVSPKKLSVMFARKKEKKS